MSYTRIAQRDSKTALEAVKECTEIIFYAIETAWDAVKECIKKILDGSQTAWDAVKECTEIIFDATKTAWDAVKERIKKIFDGLKTAAAVNLAQQVREMIFDAIRKEESHLGLNYRDKGQKPFCAGINEVISKVAELEGMIPEKEVSGKETDKEGGHEEGRRQGEKTNKALESKIDKVLQDLNKKMENLHEDFKKLQKSAAELKKIVGKEKATNHEAFARALESMLDMNLRQHSRRIKNLAEDIQEWQETTKVDLQLHRAYLEKILEYKEEEIARALESKLKKNSKQLFRKIESVTEDIQEWRETTEIKLWLFRVELENNKGNKEKVRKQVTAG